MQIGMMTYLPMVLIPSIIAGFLRLIKHKEV